LTSKKKVPDIPTYFKRVAFLQLLRRHRRTSAEKDPTTGTLTSTDVNSLRVMLLGMINDPRMVLIKLADRLHNMRTM
jgi:(p)ppGpp synthase/HD superfamily hydrolase